MCSAVVGLGEQMSLLRRASETLRSCPRGWAPCRCPPELMRGRAVLAKCRSRTVRPLVPLETLTSGLAATCLQELSHDLLLRRSRWRLVRGAATGVPRCSCLADPSARWRRQAPLAPPRLDAANGLCCDGWRADRLVSEQGVVHTCRMGPSGSAIPARADPPMPASERRAAWWRLCSRCGRCTGCSARGCMWDTTEPDRAWSSLG